MFFHHKQFYPYNFFSDQEDPMTGARFLVGHLLPSKKNKRAPGALQADPNSPHSVAITPLTPKVIWKTLAGRIR